MTVHLIEPLGRGGIFQHTVAIAQALAAAGVPVQLHTARDCELDPGVATCRCVDWKRGTRRSAWGKSAIARSYATRTLPHLLRSVDKRDIVHFQGLFKAGLGTMTVLAMRARGVPVVFSPHNTFARSGHIIDRAALRVGLRAAGSVIVYSQHDAEIVDAAARRVEVSPLIPWVPPVDDARVRRWRAIWGRRPTALVAGQLRPDKGVGAAVEAAEVWGDEMRLAVVGEDAGAERAARALADERRVDVSWTIGYVDVLDFVAAIAAADVVLCPYERASQSAILSVAHAVGTPTVATAAGGLDEIAGAVVPSSDPRALAASALRAVGRRAVQPDQTPAAVQAHLNAYHAASRAHARVASASRVSTGSRVPAPRSSR